MKGIEQFYHNVDTVPGGDNFKARVDVLLVEESLAVVHVLEEVKKKLYCKIRRKRL